MEYSPFILDVIRAVIWPITFLAIAILFFRKTGGKS